jgi:hypothetical protein
MNRFLVLLICLAAFLAGCGDSSCGSHLVSPMTGAGGLSVAVSGISTGGSVPCSGLSGGSTCAITVNFNISQLTQAATAQLVIEICTDADGNSFASENPGQSPVFTQPGSIALAPNSTGGSLQGTLGPPVSGSVRFAVQIVLLDSNGQMIAASERIEKLSPQ